MKKDTLRLLVTSKCNNACPYCVNNQYDIDNLPVLSFKDLCYDNVIITGGEPLLFTSSLTPLCKDIKGLINDKVKIIIQTSMLSSLVIDFYNNYKQDVLLRFIDGITLSIHNKASLQTFYYNDNYIHKESNLFRNYFKRLSLRLNVMDGITLDKSKVFGNWTIKENIVPINPCPVLPNEDFKRLSNLFI